MEENVSDIKMIIMQNIMRKKTECLDETSPEEIDEDVGDIKNDNSEINDKKTNWIPI